MPTRCHTMKTGIGGIASVTNRVKSEHHNVTRHRVIMFSVGCVTGKIVVARYVKRIEMVVGDQVYMATGESGRVHRDRMMPRDRIWRAGA